MKQKKTYRRYKKSDEKTKTEILFNLIENKKIQIRKILECAKILSKDDNIDKLLQEMLENKEFKTFFNNISCEELLDNKTFLNDDIETVGMFAVFIYLNWKKKHLKEVNGKIIKVEIKENESTEGDEYRKEVWEKMKREKIELLEKLRREYKKKHKRDMEEIKVKQYTSIHSLLRCKECKKIDENSDCNKCDSCLSSEGEEYFKEEEKLNPLFKLDRLYKWLFYIIGWLNAYSIVFWLMKLVQEEVIYRSNYHRRLKKSNSERAIYIFGIVSTIILLLFGLIFGFWNFLLFLLIVNAVIYSCYVIAFIFGLIDESVWWQLLILPIIFIWFIISIGRFIIN